MTPAQQHFFLNARLIDPETGRDAPGAMKVSAGLIEAVDFGDAPSLPGLAEALDQMQAIRAGAQPGPAAPPVTDCGGKPLAPGLIDMRVFVGEPGARHRESFRSAGQAAAAGGVTTIVAQPDTDPPMDDPALITFALARADEVSDVNVLTMGALTRGLQGTEMSEQRFLLDAGAVALTDGDHAVADAKILRAAMTYATATGALIVHHCQDPSLSAGACATSGEFAARLGLPTVPAIAERIALERDLALVESTGARYHADQVTTAGALPAPAPGPRCRAEGHGGHVDPSSDAERIRHCGLPHVLQADPTFAQRGRPPRHRRRRGRGSDRRDRPRATCHRTKRPSACPSKRPQPVPSGWRPSCPQPCAWSMTGRWIWSRCSGAHPLPRHSCWGCPAGG